MKLFTHALIVTLTTGSTAMASLDDDNTKGLLKACISWEQEATERTGVWLNRIDEGHPKMKITISEKLRLEIGAEGPIEGRASLVGDGVKVGHEMTVNGIDYFLIHGNFTFQSGYNARLEITPIGGKTRSLPVECTSYVLESN